MISATVIITVGIQVYRNIQNYQLNKQQFMNEVQQALDISVEAYYANQVKGEIIVLNSFNDQDSPSFLGGNFPVSGSITAKRNVTTVFDGLTISKETKSAGFSSSFQDSVLAAALKNNIRITSKLQLDSILTHTHRSVEGVKLDRTVNVSDSIDDLKVFTNRLFFALTQDLDFVKMDSFLTKELGRKNMKIDYALLHNVRDSVRKSSDEVYPLFTVSKSTYLPDGQELEMNFENASMVILKRGAVDLLISLLISAVVIGSLLYLYRVITEQKELADIKNDLISNITHEFKTPIATVSTAIEAISNFNQTNDKEKTAKYLDISNNQLQKLNGMVEKLLETASLDSDDLDLNLETVEVVKFTQQIFENFQLTKGDKKLLFQTEISSFMKEVDPFHLENALSNLVDNAIKYGGNEITLKLAQNEDQLVWHVIDTGNSLDEVQQKRIFDQFYRVPKGNVHDVKGFGIGLYYTKKIVEKHGGNISLKVSSETNFTISI
ncbi:sensor histidine kinase [Roseivirga sp.]|uniref:sensor histidine kinase n=1 Tax=Roseivirga sp. TaxID=1964215 RepID=UPI003B8C82D1